MSDLTHTKANKKKQLKKQAIMLVILFIVSLTDRLITDSADNQVIQSVHLFVRLLLLISLCLVGWRAVKNRREIIAIETLTVWLANKKIANLLKGSELNDFCIPHHAVRLIFRDDNYKTSQFKHYLTELGWVLTYQDAFALETYYRYENINQQSQ
ncbi:MAG: hypothetical protein EKK54_06225 [Neisseriaceae bacterium]|nr:MAG: hypothetical protein EKK54_06225 [Neisseriaceae bacterium]